MTNEQIKYIDDNRNGKINRFPVGTKFIRSGPKHPLIETVIDYITHTNLNGDVVKGRYITSHEFCGQTIETHDVTSTTIARSELVTGS